MVTAYREWVVTMQPKKVILHIGGSSQTEVEAVRAEITDELIQELGLVLGEQVRNTHPAFSRLLALYGHLADFEVTFFALTPEYEEPYTDY